MLFYEIKGLDPAAAKKLLCHYAMPEEYSNNITGSLGKAVEDMVEVCKGMPLALRVMGAALQGNRDAKRWQVRLKTASRLARPQLPQKGQQQFQSIVNTLDTHPGNRQAAIQCSMAAVRDTTCAQKHTIDQQ
jgi:hypothetical protein